MEYALPELLTREDLLRILQEERRLKIPGIADLPHPELLRIYKTFAVPLAKREQRNTRTGKERLKRVLEYTSMEVDEQETSYSNKLMKFTNISLIGDKSLGLKEKRHFDYEEYLNDESLCSETKRIKIEWS